MKRVVTIELSGPITPELREEAITIMRAALVDLEQNPQCYPVEPGDKPSILMRLRDRKDVEIELNAKGLSIA